MKNCIFPYSLLLFHLSFVICHSAFSQQDYTQYVNPFIGTGGHGHTFPGATVPFGMVQLSPDTRIDGSWDGCSGYHYSDNKIYGFSHTHLSGTGCSDYGDIMLMPQTVYTKVISPKFYGTTFKHENEKAEAGYYEVKLDNKINCEFTSSTRVGFHKYSFPNTKNCYLVLDLLHRDKLLEGNFKLIDGKRIEGYRVSEAWAKKQYVYFVMEFSEPIKINTHGANDSTQCVIVFTTKKKTPLLVKVGISQTSIEGARKNLETEIPHWDFEKTKAEAKVLWNKELSKIDVTQSSNLKSSNLQINQLTIFYTALYHCMIHPSVASDVDGKYRGMDLKIHEAKDFTYYTVFSLWDTFRALHPLFTIIDQKRTNDFIKTFLAMYEEGGRLPVWELSSNETDCMIGYHSVSAIVDAYEKGIRDYPTEEVFHAMIASANKYDYRGLKHYNLNGFLSIEDESESVSKTLEYGYDDWCISLFTDDFNYDFFQNFIDRSISWRNIFDSKTNFIRPRSNGGWLEPFEPREVNNNYTEANGWQYTFYVPHDINTMIDWMGGNKIFENKLDELFSTSSQTTGRTQADITGLIGQYAHGNEPSHHMAYLYDYVGAPHKTQKIVHQIKTEFYKNAPDGLIGNEDCGQMSAWYVFSSLGFYPVCPGDPKYVIGAPSFEKAIIHLENGKDFTVNAIGIDENNFYLNGTSHYVLEHEKIMGGGSLSFHMRNTPENIKKDVDYFWPVNRVFNSNFIPIPLIKNGGRTFQGMDMISIHHADTNLILEYTFCHPYLDSCSVEPSIYADGENGFPIDESYTIWARAIDKNGLTSKWVSASGHKIEHNYSIEILSKYNPQYTAGGDNGIIDGLFGDKDWRKGGWQGYQTQDFECIIDLQEEKTVSSLSADFLQDTRSWIFWPKQVEFYYSMDGKEFKRFGSEFKFGTIEKDEVIQTANATVEQEPVLAKYIKVKAINYGKLPSWHIGYGMEGADAFIFIDEITIK